MMPYHHIIRKCDSYDWSAFLILYFLNIFDILTTRDNNFGAHFLRPNCLKGPRDKNYGTQGGQKKKKIEASCGLSNDD
jgi:hypothetical protein